MEKDGILKLSIAVFVVMVMIGAVVGAVYILASKKERDGDLVIYCYDSFVSWGMGPEVEAAFEAKYDVNISIVQCGDVGGLIGRLDAEKKDPRADVALGIDNSMLHIALDKGILSTFKPANIDKATPSLCFDPEYHIIPYDYGYIAIICNGSAMEGSNIPYPDSIMDLADPAYDGKIVLLDPAASSTGGSFLVWAASVAGEGLESYLDDLAGNANGRVVGSWDLMYAAFMAGEVPIAISYGLDTAYEKMYYNTTNTVTIVPDSEGYRQIEGVGIVKGAKHRDLAEKFVEFCLTDEFQAKVGYNVMLPAVPGTAVEPIYAQFGEFATTHVEPAQGTIRSEFDSWLEQWDRSFS